MYTIHPAAFPTHDAELSRRAAARYAVLTAVKERRSRLRHDLRDPRQIPARPPVPHILALPVSPRC